MTSAQPGIAPDSEAVFVSAVVCTRNRGPSIKDTVATILANNYPNFELVVVDQSTNDLTAQAVAPFLSDTRLRYIRTATRGLDLARNIGLEQARAELVIMTDDDCDVPNDWLAQMAAVFAKYPDVAVAFCNVVAGPFDEAQGFVPVSVTAENALINSLESWAAHEAIGIGAGMAYRRAIVQQLGGFDPLLDAGAPFCGGGDTDIGLRAILNGYSLYRTKDVSVRHHGFRSFAEGRDLVRGYVLGESAMYAKLLKCGHQRVLATYLRMILKVIVIPLFESLRQFRKPPVLGRITYLAKGFVRGWRTPVDRSREVFQAP